VLLKRHFERLLLCPSDLKPLRDDFEVVGAFNPGAISANGEVILLVRVAEQPRERRPGFVGLPRRDLQAGLTIDWVPVDELEFLDPRVVRRKANGIVRLTFISHLRVVRCGPGRSVAEVMPQVFLPGSELEEFGVEDPRITVIDGRFYFTYVAVSRHGAATALASTADFRQFVRHGVIFCPENKDVVLFPERIDGHFVALHRPNTATPFCRPEMWVARSDDLVHWGRHEPLHGGAMEWETGRVGAGTPPVRTETGWLEIYHGNRHPTRLGEVGMYSTGVLLLDANNPAKVVRRTQASIFEPTTDYERRGFVPDVVFPTGIIETEDSFLVYYGAADCCTAVVEFEREELLASLEDRGERVRAVAIGPDPPACTGR
jgi:predicted GH43/DUF377 family glycosyl hydrolase